LVLHGCQRCYLGPAGKVKAKWPYLAERSLVERGRHEQAEMEYIIRAMRLISRDLLGEARDHHPLAVVWGPDVKPSFITWMRQNGKDERYIKICVSYLDRFVTEPIRTPEDVLKCFERCRSHNLDRALRNLLNFYRDIKGYDEGFILKLKRAIPHIKNRHRRIRAY